LGIARLATLCHVVSGPRDSACWCPNLNAAFGVSLCPIPFSDVVVQALDVTWTRDPFDLVIVAQAQVNRQAALITRDRTLQIHYKGCVW